MNLKSSLVLKWIFLALAIIWAVYFFLHLFQSPDFSDFQVYYLAGQKAAQHHTVYDVVGHYQYKYSPWIAWVDGVTFSQFPFATSAWIHFGVTLGLWLGLIIFWIKEVQFQQSASQWLVLGASFLFLYAKGLRDELMLGQANAWVFVALSLAYVFLKKRWLILSGMALVIALQLKLYCAFFLPLLFLRKEWRVFLGMFFGAVLTNGIWLSLVHSPTMMWSENTAWISSLFQSSQELLYSKYNVSLVGMLGKWTQNHFFAVGLWGVACVLYLIMMPRWSKYSLLEGWIYGLLGIVILNPLVWPYWMLLTLPAWLLWWRSAGREKLAVVLALGVTWNLQDRPWGTQGAMLVASLVLFYLVGLRSNWFFEKKNPELCP